MGGSGRMEAAELLAGAPDCACFSPAGALAAPGRACARAAAGSGPVYSIFSQHPAQASSTSAIAVAVTLKLQTCCRILLLSWLNWETATATITRVAMLATTILWHAHVALAVRHGYHSSRWRVEIILDTRL